MLSFYNSYITENLNSYYERVIYGREDIDDYKTGFY